MDVGEQLTKSRELQQSKESTSGHLVPVQLKVLPVQLAEKLAVNILYRYNLKFYRYNLLENWQWTYCTGTTCLKINISEIVSVQLKVLPVQLHGTYGICSRIRSVREGTFVNEPKWENHIGGGYKRKRTQAMSSFALLGFRFWKNKSFSPFFGLELVDPDFRFLLF